MRKLLKLLVSLLLVVLFVSCSNPTKKLKGVWVCTNKSKVSSTVLDLTDDSMMKVESLILGFIFKYEYNYSLEKDGEILILKTNEVSGTDFNGKIKLINDSIFILDDSIKYYKCPDYSKQLSGRYYWYIDTWKNDKIYIEISGNDELELNNKNEKIKFKTSIFGNILCMTENSNETHWLIIDENHLAVLHDPMGKNLVVEAVKDGHNPIGLKINK